MYWDVCKVELIGPRSIRVNFEDGLQGDIVFESDFFQGVFAPLMDSAKFSKVRVEDGCVTWPGGLDLAPDAMHAEIKSRGCWRVA